MASTIKVKRSSSSGAAPNTTHISTGEIALNTADGILYSSDGSSVFEIGANLTSLAVNGDTTFTSADAGSTAGPEFKLYRNSSSPADGDYLGQIKFAGESDTGVERNYAKITGKIGDATNGTEDGIIEIAHIKAGSQNINVRMTSTEFKIMNGTDFDIETHDGSSNGLRLNGTLVTSTAAELNRLDGISSAAVGETDSQTLTNKTLTSPSIGTGFTLDSVTIGTIQTSGESFADNDTSLMTSAAIDDRINAAGGGGASALNDLSDAITNSSGQTIGIGTNALANDDGSDNFNTALGYKAGEDITSGTGGVFVGYEAGLQATTSNYPIAIGYEAIGAGVMTGTDNIGIGREAGNDLNSGTYNVMMGYRAGWNATTADKTIAIGMNAIGLGVLTGDDNIAIGEEAGYDLTSGTFNFFGGYRAGWNATTTNNTIAIGRQAIGLGVLIGNGNIGIGRQAGYDLTSGNDNVMMGHRAGYNATTGSLNVAIGYYAIGLGVLTGDYNTAVGYQAGNDITSGTNNNFMGYAAGGNVTTGADNTILGTNAGNALITGSNNIIIGHDAAASATNVSNEITLGDANITKLRVPGLNFIIKDSTATEDYVLTVDASGEAGWEAAGGGGGSLELYAENPSSPTAPSATGTNAVAIGSGSIATGAKSLAFSNSRAAGLDSFAAAIRSNLSTFGAKTSGSVAIGNRATSGSAYSVAIGNTATTSTGLYATAIGAASTAAGANSIGAGAMALGGSYASGTDSFAAAISNNSSSYGATGANSVAIGGFAKSNNSNSIAIGRNSQSTGSGSVAIGGQGSGSEPIASGSASIAIGVGTRADGIYSMALGSRAVVGGIRGKQAWTGYAISGNNDGASQSGKMVLARNTTDATPSALTTYSNPSTTNQVILPNNSAYAFHGTIVARQQASAGTACAAWKIEGLIRREGSAGATVLVNSATTVLDNTPAWGMALSADTTNGGLAITVTGAAATNIRWVATIHTSEVTYA